MTPPVPLTLPTDDEALDWVQARTERGLARAREVVDTIRHGGADLDPMALLHRWDEVALALSNVSAVASLFANVHPRKDVRTACEQAEVAVDRLVTELRQDRGLYDAFVAVDASNLDPVSARLLAKSLEDFERAGVDRDEATRTRLAEINARLVELDQTFERTIREDVRTVRVEPARLKGLPADWLEAHPAGEDGLVSVTTEYPDTVPTMMFAHDRDLRLEVITAFLQRGYPDNEAVLREMFDLRHELAGLVGYADWASYDAAVKMIGSGPAIPEFIDRITEVSEEPMRRDLALLLERIRQDVPDAEVVDRRDSAYYEEVVRKERYEVDSQEVRTYFAFDRVRQGLLEVTGRLFGVRYEPVPDAVVWHPDVTVHDVHRLDESGADAELIGRIYLDLHPRADKFSHAAQFTITNGVAGRQLPEGALVCNFSKGLMEHDHVVTLFHEFGHLVHHVLGGAAAYTRFSGVATEWDFVEAPSQMLEEWAWDTAVLQSFAVNADGEPIPADLVDRMRAADDFGKGYMARQQMFYAAISYWFHTERPEDLTARMVELAERYSPWAHIDGTHFHASFGHLGGYSSAYYTYMWSLVIAKDLFSAFDPDDLFDAEVAGRYRDRVLVPGGTADAADLVADFLGRTYTFEAYAEWLGRA